MKNYFQIVKDYLITLNYKITYENSEDGIMKIEYENEGIKNLVLGISDPILIFEQFIFTINTPTADIYKALLQKNRDVIHGAFVLDETGKKVIFRDTLQLENLDLNEMEATLNSLILLLSEYTETIMKFSSFK